MNVPTAADVRAESKLDFGSLDYAADTGPGGLQLLVDRAAAQLRRITGLDLSTIPDDDPRVPLIEQAVQGLTEQLAQENSPDRLETMSDWDLIQSFSVGPYSETRRGPEAARQARLLNPWLWLSQILWELLTDEQYDYWTFFFSGQNRPAWGVQEVEWDNNTIGYEDIHPFGT